MVRNFNQDIGMPYTHNKMASDTPYHSMKAYNQEVLLTFASHMTSVIRFIMSCLVQLTWKTDVVCFKQKFNIIGE